MNEQGPDISLGLGTPSRESPGYPHRAFPIHALPPPPKTKRLRSNTATVTLKTSEGASLQAAGLLSCLYGRHVLGGRATTARWNPFLPH